MGAALLQKSKNTKSGSEMQRDKEALAEMMRQKQKKGTCIETLNSLSTSLSLPFRNPGSCADSPFIDSRREEGRDRQEITATSQSDNE